MIINEDVQSLPTLDNESDGPDQYRIERIMKTVLALQKTEGEAITKEFIEKRLNEAGLPEDINIGYDSIGKDAAIKLLETLRSCESIAKDPNNPGHVSREIAEHIIDTGDSKPINQGPRRVSPDQRRIIKEQIDKLLKAGIIAPSRSPWASPVLLVPKGQNDWRMCIDYRKLNEVTKKEIYAIPRIDDVLDSMSGAQFNLTL